MAALAPPIGALFTVAACYSLGSLLLARLRLTLRRAEKPPLAFTLGAATLHLLIFAILALHIAYTPVLVSVLGVIITGAVWTGDWRLPERAVEAKRDSWLAQIIHVFFFGAAGAFTVLYFVYAWAPEISPDGSTYHLPVIARYLRVHGFQPVPTNFYASLSEGVEMLFLPAYSIGGGSAAALVHFAFLIALALAVRAYGHRALTQRAAGHGLAGDAAALLVYLSPVAGIDGTSAYIDVATAAVVFAAFYWTQLWDEDRRSSLLVCIGLLGGFCYAAKYTAAIMAIYGAGYVLWRTRSARAATLVVACAAIMAGPWLVKNWIYVRNPIAPFGNRVFRNPYIHVELERRWTAYLRTYGLTDMRKLPWDAVVEGAATQTPLGPVFLLLPLGLLALRKRAGRRVLAPAALLLSTYFTNLSTRFLLPSLPFLSLALAMALEELPWVLLIIVMFHATASWPPHVRRFSRAPWVLQRWPLQAALRKQTEENYVLGRPAYLSEPYRAAWMIERFVPPGEKVLTLNSLAQSYTQREIVVSYQGAFNEQMNDILSSGWATFWSPSRALEFRFPEHMLRRIRVVQTAAVARVDEQWSVHEFRIFDGVVEVPRSADWRLRAFPNPWLIPYAFDNSEITRWRSWETAAPGMYIDVEFARGVRADRVRVETSGDNPDVRLRLEEMNASDQWTPLARAPEEFVLVPETSLRRAAAYELRSNGVRYIFVRDDDPGAEYYAQDPASWDFTPVAHGDGATIYKVGQ